MRPRSIGLLSAASLTLCGSNTPAGEPMPYTEALGYATASLPLPDGADTLREFWSVRLFRDVNHDGIDDLVLGPAWNLNYDQWVGFSLGTTDGRFEQPIGFDISDFSGQNAWSTPISAGVGVSPGLPGMFAFLGDDLVFIRQVEGTPGIAWSDDVSSFHPQLWTDEWPDFEVGDLDQDGIDEVFFISFEDGQSVIRWSSREEATRYETYETKLISPYVQPIRDYDADGHADILIVSEVGRGLVVFPGTGTDELGPPSAVDYDAKSAGIQPCVGSFDVDPALDLLTLSEFPPTATFVMNFATDRAEVISVPFPGRIDERFGSVDCIGDLDSDGLDELVVFLEPDSSHESHSYAVWSKPLDADSTLERFFAHGGLDAQRRVIDANQDGLPDLGVFSGEVRVALTREEPGDRPRFGSSPVAPGSKALHALPVDLEGDGTVGIVFTGGEEGYSEDPTTPSPVAPLNVSGSSFMSVAPDLDGDGSPELVITSTYGFEVFPVHADGSPGTPVFYDFDENREERVYGLAFGDLDGDGTDDVVASTRSDTRIYRSIGETTLIETAFFGGGSQMIRPQLADANEDGFLDLFLTDRQDVIFYLGDGKGGISTEFFEIEMNAAHWFEVVDLDHDGHLDIVGVRGTGASVFHYEPTVSFGDGSGGFTEAIDLPAKGKFVEVQVVDIDRNGLNDILLSDGQTLFVADDLGVNENSGVILQIAPRVFQPMVALPQQEGAGIAVADFNNDGGMDVVTVGTAAVGALIHWGEPAPCSIDYFPDGVLNFFDLGEFLGLFSSQDPAADLAAPEGIWNFFDLAEFLTLFGQGCP